MILYDFVSLTYAYNIKINNPVDGVIRNSFLTKYKMKYVST